MPCPFFIPTERLDGVFKFPDRLPLAPGFSGVCGAPEQMLARPTDEELRDHCNLGHASCTRLPKQRHADAVRFSAKAVDRHTVSVRYVYEVECWPAGGGELRFDEREQRWLTPAPDDKLQRQAECFLRTWRERAKGKAAGA